MQRNKNGLRGLITGFFCLAGTVLIAQPDEAKPCGTYTATQKFIGSNAGYIQNRNELQQFTDTFKYNPASREASKIIPVVVHIIHNYGAENIADEQVYDAIRILNDDFNKLNSDIAGIIPAFQSRIATVGFEFRLARKDPNGNCTNGITRTVSALTYSANDNVKALVSWPTNHYLNIWVVQNISFSAGGYSYLPGLEISSGLDGVVVVNRQFGSIGTSSGSNLASRTLTHEVGHWFNLSHVWGDGDIGSSANCSAFGDYVGDTPKTIGTNTNDCNLAQNTCHNELPDEVDNVQNFMDYSSCASMFTNGQKNRMIAAANSAVSGRKDIWSAANLSRTGVDKPAVLCIPVVDFKANSNQACPGTNLNLSDKSYNAPVDQSWQWSWQMPGGNPSSSSEQNPSVNYPNPGAYTITLTVTNSAGTASLTRNNYIYINTNEPSLEAPQSEGFEGQTFPNASPDFNKNWRFDDPANGFTRTNSAKASGSYALHYQNLRMPEGNQSALISPPMRFQNISNPATLRFKVAYAMRNAESSDKLEVFTSVDCGKNWVRRYSKSGSNLATISNTLTSPFTPGNASQWRTESINLGGISGAAKVMFKFLVSDGGGNNLYLDDIELGGNVVLAQEELQSSFPVQLYPNPGDGDAVLEWAFYPNEESAVIITDLAGRVLGQKNFGTRPSGSNSIKLSELAGAGLAPGSYLVTLQQGSFKKVLPWIAR